MQSLPLIVSLVVAFAIAPAALKALRNSGLVRENYRGRSVAFPAGFVIVAAALLALAPLALIQRLASGSVFRPELGLVAVYALGVAFLGLVDDTLGGEGRGWRGHGAEILRGSFSTGALKAVGSLGLAMFVLVDRYSDDLRWLLAVGVLVLATNLFNLLDLRPGRSVKAFVMLGAGLTLGAQTTRPLAALGLFAGPALALGIWDVRERAMLGDTGSNLLGALAGLWLVLALGQTGQVVAFVVLILITVYGEFRSISELVERAPLLRQLDSLGRPR